MSERGSVTVLMAGVVGLGLAVVLGRAAVGQLLVARGTASAAADAGALAAAPVTFRPFGASGSATAEAARFTSANGARVVRCDCASNSTYADRIVVVEVELNVAVLGRFATTVTATSAAEFRPVELLGIP